MLIKVKVGSRGFNINIPISLFVLDQTFDALEDLLWVWEKFFLNRFARKNIRSHVHAGNFLKNFDSRPSQVLGLCRELVDELRRYGRWRMVEVEVNRPASWQHGRNGDEVRIYIDFI